MKTEPPEYVEVEPISEHIELPQNKVEPAAKYAQFGLKRRRRAEERPRPTKIQRRLCSQQLSPGPLIDKVPVPEIVLLIVPVTDYSILSC